MIVEPDVEFFFMSTCVRTTLGSVNVFFIQYPFNQHPIGIEMSYKKKKTTNSNIRVYFLGNHIDYNLIKLDI